MMLSESEEGIKDAVFDHRAHEWCIKYASEENACGRWVELVLS